MVKAPQVSYGHRIVVEVNKKDNIIIRKTTMVQQKMKRNYCTEFPFALSQILILRRPYSYGIISICYLVTGDFVRDEVGGVGLNDWKTINF